MLKLELLDWSLGLLQIYARDSTCEYQTFVDNVNDALPRVSPTESTVLIWILRHMLYQIQIRERVRSENMESRD